MAATTGLVAAAAGFTGAFGAAILWAVFAAGALAAGAFAAGFADLCCISLLFLEDFAADAALWAALVSLAGARARLLDALRCDAAAFFVSLEALVLRVFCDTACARNCHAPVHWFSMGTQRGHKRADGVRENGANIAHFPQKSMIYSFWGAFFGLCADIRVKLGPPCCSRRLVTRARL